MSNLNESKDWISEPCAVHSKVRKPNVTHREVDHSIATPMRGMNSSFCYLDTSAFQAGRRMGKSFMTAQLMKNKWSMLYHFGNCKKTPELYYAATNPAFANPKNKLPRGVARKLAILQKQEHALVDSLSNRELFLKQQPTCGECGTKQVQLLASTGKEANWRCRHCDHTFQTTITGRIVVNRVPAFHNIKDELQ